jgi:predicted nucleotidyltransferase
MATIAGASLTSGEREALERFVSALVAALGDDVDAVWLYGSRARGEQPHAESDIDVIILTRDGEADSLLATRAALDSGEDGLRISPLTTTRRWIEQRRAIDSFFIGEVDRDKIVLFGDP